MVITELHTACYGLNIAPHPDMWVETLPWAPQKAAVFETSEIRPFIWASNLKKKFKRTKEPQGCTRKKLSADHKSGNLQGVREGL